MEAKNRKRIIIASSVVLVGGLIGGTIGAAVALSGSANDQPTQQSSAGDNFYDTGKSIYSGDPTAEPIRWTPPVETNPYQNLFYIAAGEQDFQGQPLNVMMVNPNTNAANGYGTPNDNFIYWEQLQMAGYDFVTQQTNEGLYHGVDWKNAYITPAFTFENHWLEFPGQAMTTSFLSPVAYDKSTQTYDISNNIVQSIVQFLGDGTLRANTMWYEPTTYDNFRVTSVEPTNDVLVWDSPTHVGQTYTQYSIGWNEDSYTNSAGESTGDISWYIDTTASMVEDNTKVKTTRDKTKSGQLYLFPILTVKQDKEASTNGNLVMYLTFGGFQTPVENDVQYRIVDYSTGLEVKAWTLIGNFQSMDNYQLTLTGLEENKTYLIQFSSSFAYKNWAEYKFSVGDATDTYWSEYDFYNQFPDAKIGNDYGWYYLVDPNTGMVINYKNPTQVATSKNPLVWGTQMNTQYTGYGSSAPMVYTQDLHWHDPSTPQQTTASFEFYSQYIGMQRLYLSGNLEFSGASAWGNGYDTQGSANWVYNVNENNIIQIAVPDDMNTNGMLEMNEFWKRQLYSSPGSTVPGYENNVNYVINSDASKPSGTNEDGFIAVPSIGGKTLENYMQITQNSISFTLCSSVFQDTDYKLYYTITNTTLGTSESELIYLDSYSTALNKQYTVNNLLPNNDYIISFYLSNAANSVLFPEVANKYYKIVSFDFKTSSTLDETAAYSLGYGMEFNSGKDHNNDGDTTDLYLAISTTDTNPYDAGPMASTFYLNIYNSSNSLVVKEYGLSEYAFTGKSKQTIITLSTETFPQLAIPDIYYFEVVQVKNGGEKIISPRYLYDMSLIKNPLGEITSISSETTLGQDVNGDSDMSDATIQFTTSESNQYVASPSNVFTVSVFDATNNIQIISEQPILDKTVFEGQNTSSWIAIDGWTLEASLYSIQITMNTQGFTEAVLIDKVQVDNT